MTILATYDIDGVGLDLYDDLAGQMGAGLRASPGFVFHLAHALENGWRVMEVWDSRDQYDRWYNGTVKPGLPADLKLSIQVVEVHAVIQP